MIGLLDVNVLIALFDPRHGHHEAAHEWFAANRKRGWATCPLTENGFLRVLSNPAYPGRRSTVQEAAQHLEGFCQSGDHSFWPADISLRETSRFRLTRIAGHRQLTDAYLLGLAMRQGGRLVTFDRSISRAAVPGGGKKHLEVIA